MSTGNVRSPAAWVGEIMQPADASYATDTAGDEPGVAMGGLYTGSATEEESVSGLAASSFPLRSLPTLHPAL